MDITKQKQTYREQTCVSSVEKETETGEIGYGTKRHRRLWIK